jgi:hypothetical protein
LNWEKNFIVSGSAGPISNTDKRLSALTRLIRFGNNSVCWFRDIGGAADVKPTPAVPVTILFNSPIFF